MWGSVPPKQSKVLSPLIGHRSFGCHLKKSSNLSCETGSSLRTARIGGLPQAGGFSPFYYLCAVGRTAE